MENVVKKAIFKNFYVYGKMSNITNEQIERKIDKLNESKKGVEKSKARFR